MRIKALKMEVIQALIQLTCLNRYGALLNFTNPIRIELILIIKITAINNKIPQSIFKTGHKTKRNAKKNITSAIESNLEPKTVSFSQILAIYPSRISLRPHKIKIIKK